MSVTDLIKNDPQFQQSFQIEKEKLKQEFNNQTLTQEKIIQIIVTIIKILFLIFLIYLSYQIITTKVYQGVFPFDNANVVIHETGHTLYRIAFIFLQYISIDLYKFIHILGGSLNQILLPFFIGIYFAVTKRWYSCFFCIFWIGDNISLVSYYLADARCICAPLYIGEDFSVAESILPTQHDWNNILTRLGLLQYDLIIGDIFRFIGIAIMIVGLALMIINIYIGIVKISTNNLDTSKTV